MNEPNLSGWERINIDVPGSCVAVHRRGSGVPFYWCHGITSSSLDEVEVPFAPWRGLEDGWEVVLVDARGHGCSAPDLNPTPYRWASLGEDLLAIAGHLGHSEIVVGGTSMGAAIALHAAALAPEKMLALVLMMPPTGWEHRGTQRKEYLDDADVVQRQSAAVLAAAMAQRGQSSIFKGFYDPEAAALQRFSHLEPAQLSSILRGAADSDLPDPECLGELRQPVLILALGDDPGHPVETTETIGRALPNATVCVAHSIYEVMQWPAVSARFLIEPRAGSWPKPRDNSDSNGSPGRVME